MSRFNTQTSHPLIPNSQEYQFEQQYISIHSEDRNILKYPNASEFEIQLPQDYQNVQGFRLASGCFPVNFTMFSPKSKNVTMTFQITKPYDASQLVPLNPIQTKIEAMLTSMIGKTLLLCETGNYHPSANDYRNPKQNECQCYILPFRFNYYIDGGRSNYI